MGDMTTAEPDEAAPATATSAPVAAEGTATPAPDAGAPAGGSTEIQATLREWAIDLSVQEVAAGNITIVVTNQGQFAHNLTVTDASGTLAKTPNFRSNQGPQTLEVELEPGTYTLICDLPGHAAQGQRTELVVR
jgi:plastocyanin